MDILLISTESQCDCFISTCIIKGFRKKYKNRDIKIDCIVKKDNDHIIFKYNKFVRKVYSLHNLNKVILKEYDLSINLSPDFTSNIKAKKKLGFYGSNPISTKTFNDVIYETKKIHKNVFQVYYNIANMKWKGESYDFHYFPKTKTNKKKTGIYITNINLRKYIINKLKLDESVLWTIPYKNQIIRKINEINKCSNVITDDYFTMHLSVFLRKHVFFLKTVEYTTKLEFFGKGNVLTVPVNLIK